MTKIYKCIMTLMILGLIFSGCSKSVNDFAIGSEAKTTPFTGKYVVNADYVKKRFPSDDVILIDARGKDAADKETIAGAITFTWKDISVMEGKPGDAMWGTSLPHDQLAVKLGEFGVNPNKEIILFSNAQNGWGEDGRIAWQLIMANYPNVKIVDGGINKLKKAGLNTTKGANSYSPCTITIDTLNEYACIHTDVLENNDNNYTIIDVRTKDEYNGKTPYGEAKGGHLPGAVNIHFKDLFNADNTIKSNDIIEAMLKEKGITKEDQIVTYCTSGIRSAYMQMILEMCGYQALNYDESYYRWSKVNDVEITPTEVVSQK